MLIFKPEQSRNEPFMQIVYISNRPKVLLETLAHVALFMPFIDRAIACVPDEIANQFLTPDTPLPLNIINESSILDKSEYRSIKQLDHQSHNYLLRARLMEHQSIDAQFIMSDDDARPLKSLGIDRYLSDDRYHRYYFYDLRQWDNNQTEFDVGQLSSGAILEYNNLPSLSYASHMPQIVDKALYREATQLFSQYASEFPLCEWSTYFNYAAAKHPDKFHQAEAYKTLCWPEHPLAWKHYTPTSEFLFENYTPRQYEQKQVFEGLSPVVANLGKLKRINLEKIVRWRKYSISCQHPEQAKGYLKYFRLRTWINKLFGHLHQYK